MKKQTKTYVNPLLSPNVWLAAALLALALLLAAPAAAQRGNTRFEQVFDDLDSAPAPRAILPPRAMIGQSQHLLTVLASDAPSQTCLPFVAEIALEASYVGGASDANWFRIGQPLLLISSGLRGELRVNGAYPYVGVKVVDFDDTNCTLDVFYSGTVAPAPGDSGVIEPGYASGFRQTKVEATTAGSGVATLIAAPASGYQICLYGAHLGVLSGAELRLKNDAVNNTSNTIIGPLWPTANSQISLPTGAMPWSCFGVDNPLTVRVSSATTVGGVLVWRAENVTN